MRAILPGCHSELATDSIETNSHITKRRNMTRKETLAYGRTLLDKHGLQDWRFDICDLCTPYESEMALFLECI